MATPPVDRTGESYGALYVLARKMDSDRQWWVIWKCCAAGEFMDSMKVAYLAKHPPACCKACSKAPKAPKDPAKAKPKPDLRVRTKTAQESMEAARAQEGIHIPGRGWWPVLHGPMGPRHGMGWTVYERRVPGDERGARS